MNDEHRENDAIIQSVEFAGMVESAVKRAINALYDLDTHIERANREFLPEYFSDMWAGHRLVAEKARESLEELRDEIDTTKTHLTLWEDRNSNFLDLPEVYPQGVTS